MKKFSKLFILHKYNDIGIQLLWGFGGIVLLSRKKIMIRFGVDFVKILPLDDFKIDF